MRQNVLFQCFDDLLFYKLTNEKGNGTIESVDKARRKTTRTLSFLDKSTPAPVGLLEGRGIAITKS